MNRNEIDFTAQMQAGRDNAASARYMGRHTGKCAKGWSRSKSRGPIDLDDIEAFYYSWCKDVSYQCYLAVEWALFGDEWKDLGEI